jgi:hypothetical protein
MKGSRLRAMPRRCQSTTGLCSPRTCLPSCQILAAAPSSSRLATASVFQWILHLMAPSLRGSATSLPSVTPSSSTALTGLPHYNHRYWMCVCVCVCVCVCTRTFVQKINRITPYPRILVFVHQNALVLVGATVETDCCGRLRGVGSKKDKTMRSSRRLSVLLFKEIEP